MSRQSPPHQPLERATVYFHSDLDDPVQWQATLAAALPQVRFVAGPACDAPEQVDIALVWTQPPQGLGAFPNLRAVLSLGAGVDQLQLERLDPRIPVARLVDPTLTARMVEYCKAAVFHFHRDLHLHQRRQQERRWTFIPPLSAGDRRILVLGQGELGAAVATGLAAEGFAVSGWSRSTRQLPGVRGLCGAQALPAAVAESDIVINLLPLTSDTRGLLDARFFSWCRPGACLVNVGRGAHLNEADLLAALDQGRIAAAFLDVFAQEPLPPQHPFWARPQLYVTPHVASLSDPVQSAATVVANIRRSMQGQPLLHAIDRGRGY